MSSRAVARLALVFVLGAALVAFVSWFRTRPAYLLWQAHRGLGGESQPAVIASYKKLLQDKKLSPNDEVRFRKALGELYIRAVQESAVAPFTEAMDNPFLESAQFEFKRVLELRPQDAEARYYLAHILWLRRLESFAIEEMERARKDDPSNPVALAFLAQVYGERGRMVEARDAALQALAIDPAEETARRALIDAYAGLGEHDRALDEFARLSEASRADPRTRAQRAFLLAQNNDGDAANNEIRRAAQQAPTDGWVRGLESRIHLFQGRVDEAAGAASQAADVMPKSAWPRVWLAEVAWARRDCMEAGLNARFLVENLPRWPTSHLTSAWAALCNGNADQAISQIDEALRLSPNMEDAVRLKADILFEQRRFDRLGTLLRPLLDRKVQEAAAYGLLSQSFVAQGAFPMAEETAQTALAVHPREALPYLSMASVLDARGDHGGALRALEKALQLRPFDAAIQIRILKAQSGENFAAAEAELENLIQSQPSDVRFWIVVGQWQLEHGYDPEAVQSFQSALARCPYSVDAYLGLIEAYTKQGKRELAEIALQDAVRVNPVDPGVSAWRARLGRKKTAG